MVIREISKYDTLYNKFNCSKNIIIPTNDLDAWSLYPKYNWVYNRLQIALLQNIQASPMPIMPKNFPVILKPIINLYGMGLNVNKISNKKELLEHWYSNNFWSEFLEGDHLSYDILLLNGIPQWHCCFKGYKLDNNLGSFVYWENIETELPPAINTVVEKLNDFNGCINMELIGGKIIECHLRMGDITKLPSDDIIKGIINIYGGESFNFSSIPIKKIYLFPIWISSNINKEFIDELDLNIINAICKNAYSYQIDTGTEACPGDLRRIMMISVFDYDTGINIVNDLYYYIHSK